MLFVIYLMFLEMFYTGHGIIKCTIIMPYTDTVHALHAFLSRHLHVARDV